MSKTFDRDVSEQRHKVALDLLDRLQRIEKQRDDLLAACKAMVTDFDLGEFSIEISLKMMRAAIAAATP